MQDKYLKSKLFKVLDQMKEDGGYFSPRDLAPQLGVLEYRVTALLKSREDVYKVRNPPKIKPEPPLKRAPPIWGFVKMDIDKAITKSIDKDNGVYTDDLIKHTGRAREWVTLRLKERGFKKYSDSSKRWIKWDVPAK